MGMGLIRFLGVKFWSTKVFMLELFSLFFGGGGGGLEGHENTPQETHTLCVFDWLPMVSWRRAKYKQMYGLKSTLTVSR